jgi:acetoin utilization deacetylase AcuC-like enzyme
VDFAPGPGRTVLVLEGGYDLDALRLSVGASLATVLDTPYRPEPSSAGGPGGDVVDAVRRIHTA